MTLISELKCRPKAADNLFCHLQNSTIVNMRKNRNTREVETEQMFEIKFNERGVEGLIIEPPSRMEVVNILRKIANQFSIGVDWRKIERISQAGEWQFMARENSSMGNCATVYKITRGELNTVEEEHIDFRLIVPMTDDAISNLSIEKSRIACINPPRYVDFSSGILKMVCACEYIFYISFFSLYILFLYKKNDSFLYIQDELLKITTMNKC